MTAKQIFNKIRIDSKKADKNTVFYYSMTKQMHSRVKKELNRWLSDLEFDAELGIVSLEDYRVQIEVMKNTVANVETF